MRSPAPHGPARAPPPVPDDGGHQPWRADPELVALVELGYITGRDLTGHHANAAAEARAREGRSVTVEVEGDELVGGERALEKLVAAVAVDEGDAGRVPAAA